MKLKWYFSVNRVRDAEEKKNACSRLEQKCRLPESEYLGLARSRK